MLSTSHAGRFGARAGLGKFSVQQSDDDRLTSPLPGVAFVQLGLSFRQRADEMNNSGEAPYPLPEDESVTNAFPAPTGGMTNSTASDYGDSAPFTYQTIALNEWVAMILVSTVVSLGWRRNT